MDRRSFLKTMGLIGAMSASGVSISQPSSAKTVDQPTYKKFIVGEIPKYDATNHVFSRMMYDPDFLQLRAVQGKNMKENIETGKSGFGLMEMAFRGATWAIQYSLGSGSGTYAWGGEGLYSWAPLGRPPFSTAGMGKLDSRGPEWITKWIKVAGKHF